MHDKMFCRNILVVLHCELTLAVQINYKAEKKRQLPEEQQNNQSQRQTRQTDAVTDCVHDSEVG